MESQTQKRYLTTKEAADYLGIKERTLRAQMAPNSPCPLKINGKSYRPSKVNRQARFDRERLDELMASD